MIYMKVSPDGEGRVAITGHRRRDGRWVIEEDVNACGVMFRWCMQKARGGVVISPCVYLKPREMEMRLVLYEVRYDSFRRRIGLECHYIHVPAPFISMDNVMPA